MKLQTHFQHQSKQNLLNQIKTKTIRFQPAANTQKSKDRGQNKKVHKKKQNTSTARRGRILLQVLELLQDPLRRHQKKT